MKYKNIANLLHYLLLALFMVFPGHAIDALATDDSETDRNIAGKTLPPVAGSLVEQPQLHPAQRVCWSEWHQGTAFT